MGPQKPAPRTLESGSTRALTKASTSGYFPLSNWTELDVWQYIGRENIPIVPLYYAKPRPMVVRGGSLIPVEQDFSLLRLAKKAQMVMCRMRSAWLQALHRRNSLRSRHNRQNHR